MSALEPVKLVVQALSRRDTNLITAEVALNLCIVQLQKQSSELAKTLADSLESRLGERNVESYGTFIVLRHVHQPPHCFSTIKRSHQEVCPSAVHTTGAQ